MKLEDLKNAKFNDTTIVYYNGASRDLYEHHFAYVLIYMAKSERGITMYRIKKPNGMFFSDGYNYNVINEVDILKNFISEKEYFDKYKVVKYPNSSLPNYDSKYVKKIGKFKKGDVVYYLGNDKGVNYYIKKNKPYVVHDYNENRGLVEIVVSSTILSEPEDDFILEEEFEKREFNQKTDVNYIPVNDKSEKSDFDILIRLFKDTKDGKIIWKQPFQTHDKWLRAILFLKEPPNSYLRFDLDDDKDPPALKIHYHRQKDGKSAYVNGERIKTITGGVTIQKLIKLVYLKLEK